MYLLSSLILFLSGPLSETLAHRPLLDVHLSVKGGKAGELTAEDRAAIANGFPARILGADRLIRAAESGKDFSRDVFASLPRAMFVLLPMFAALTRLLWHRRLRRYPSHLYVALHLHAAWFLMVGMVTLIAIPLPNAVAETLGVLTVVYVVGYTLIALRRIFQNGWPVTLIKSVVLIAMYDVCLLTVMLGLLAYAISKA